MFENVTPRPDDPIMAIMKQCKSDPRAHKIDLGVGVYKDDSGHTTILNSVKLAEKICNEEETTKSYVGTIGNQDFCKNILQFIFGEDNPIFEEGRVCSAQAAGGSGALRIGAELLKIASPEATVWSSTPTWANHIPLISSVGLEMKQYPYYNRVTLKVDFEEMLSHLSQEAKPGDIILLHGCCHNPTGADLTENQWDRLAVFLNENELYPFIDLAYFGLGKGMEEDTYGLRKVTQICPEVLLAASCSKNFALYRERTGFVAAICKDQEKTEMIKGLFGAIQRKLISMPPDHGAAIVNKIFTDQKLFNMWEIELSEMRNRIKSLRLKLSKAFNSLGAVNISNAIVNQNGMFSMLPLDAQQAESLRTDHAVYLMNSGRINIAGANTKNISRVAEAVLKVI